MRLRKIINSPLEEENILRMTTDADLQCKPVMTDTYNRFFFSHQITTFMNKMHQTNAVIDRAYTQISYVIPVFVISVKLQLLIEE